MRRHTKLLIAPVLVLLLLSPAGGAGAQVEFIRTGQVGGALLLNFYGGYEGAISSGNDQRQAAVQCFNNSLGRKAVFAGAAVSGINFRAGAGNDWQYARLSASAVDPRGAWVQGDVTQWFVVDDTRWGALPAVGVWLPRDGQGYTPVLGVQFVDATYRPIGAVLLGAESGATMLSRKDYPYGDYWFAYRVAPGSFYACG